MEKDHEKEKEKEGKRKKNKESLFNLIALEETDEEKQNKKRKKKSSEQMSLERRLNKDRLKRRKARPLFCVTLAQFKYSTNSVYNNNLTIFHFPNIAYKIRKKKSAIKKKPEWKQNSLIFPFSNTDPFRKLSFLFFFVLLTCSEEFHPVYFNKTFICSFLIIIITRC